MKTIKERLEEYRDKLPPFSRAYDIISGIIAELDKAEPYGWLIDYADGSIHFLTDKKLVSGFAGTNSGKVIPLYTAPQPDNKELSLRVGKLWYRFRGQIYRLCHGLKL